MSISSSPAGRSLSYARGRRDPSGQRGSRSSGAFHQALHTPADDAAAVAAERLAGATDRWTELVRDTAELAADGSDPAVAARWWTRLGGWYAERLGDADAAILRYEAAVATDGSPAALDALV